MTNSKMVLLQGVKGLYNNYEKLLKSLEDSGVMAEIFGAAIDRASSTVYLQSPVPRTWKFWSKIKLIITLEEWENSESLKAFAERRHFEFVPGTAVETPKIDDKDIKDIKSNEEPDDTLDYIRERLGRGGSLEDLECNYLVLHDYKLLTMIWKHRDELQEFQKYIKKIRWRLREEAARERQGLLFKSAWPEFLDKPEEKKKQFHDDTIFNLESANNQLQIPSKKISKKGVWNHVKSTLFGSE
jgi:hypothetical protein